MKKKQKSIPQEVMKTLRKSVRRSTKAITRLLTKFEYQRPIKRKIEITMVTS